MLPFTYAAVLIASEAGLVQNHLVLAGAIVDAALVLILVNAVQDPTPRGGRFDAADAAMRALAVVAVSRVIVIGLPLRDASLPLATLGVAALVGGTTLGIARVTGVSIRPLLVVRSAGLQRQAAVTGFALGLAAYLVGAPRLWASGAPPGRVLLGLAAAVAAACVEELLFRGLLLISLQRVAITGGLVASSGLFAATYLGSGPTSLVLVIAIAGVVFGYTVARSGSLSGALAGHALLAVGAGGLWPALFGATRLHLEHSAAVTVVLVLVTVGVGAYALVGGADRRPAAGLAEPQREVVPPVKTPAVERSGAPGHVTAVLACARRLDLSGLLGSSPGDERELCVAVISQLLISKASTVTQPLTDALSRTFMGTETGMGCVTDQEVAAAMQWLGARQAAIEARLVARHLPSDDAPPVYDVRVVGGKVYGVLSDSRALALAVRGHPGFPHDPSGLAAAVKALRASFGVRSLIVTCDQRATRDVDLSLLDRAPGWICALTVGGANGARRLSQDELLKHGQIAWDAELALRFGGTATQQGPTRVISTYREATARELRFDPPPMREPEAKRGALTATMLSAYMAWHLRAAWSDMTFSDLGPVGQPSPGRLGSVLAALSVSTSAIGPAGEDLKVNAPSVRRLRERALILIEEQVPSMRWPVPPHISSVS